MAKQSKKQDKPVTTAQRLGSKIKSARDIMRKDKGLNGELDRLPQLTWILFLKLLDDFEQLREDEASLDLERTEPFKPAIEYPYRWRDWAANDEGMSGDQLKNFINNDEVTLPDGTRCKGLFAYLRSLQSITGKGREDVIAKVFKGVNNRMDSGALLRDVINLVNDIHFNDSEEVNILSTFYESMLKEMRDAAGDSGEFYTPRSVVRFMVEVMEPQIGESIFDPACGTGGFLVEAYEYLEKQCKLPQDLEIVQATIAGGEAKSLPYMLAQMNLLLHRFEYPDIDDKNSLRHSLTELGIKNQVDIILTNPPFGGEEEGKIQKNFPPDKRTNETALLFLQLIMRLLKQKPKPGRAGIVFPNGVLFGDGICGRIKEELLKEFNLHTIVRLPNGVFAPYTSIPTNLLFFDRFSRTEEIWYYELPLPEGRKTYTKTKPLQYEEFADCLAWWKNREENEQAWKYNFREAYDKAIAEATPHWNAAKEAEETANQCVKTAKELEGKIQSLQNLILDFSPKEEIKQIKSQIEALKDEITQARSEEQRQRGIARDEQSKGDAIYWAIYNLDCKNPKSQIDLEHLPSKQLITKAWHNEQQIAAILSQIKQVVVENEQVLRWQADEEAQSLPSTTIFNCLFKEAKSSWAVGHLGDYVVEDCYGTSEKTTNDKSGIPILRMGNIQNGRLDLRELKYLHLNEKDREKLLLKKGDILVNRTNSAELVGKCAVFELEDEYAFASYIIRLRLDTRLADPRFVATYINSPAGRAYMFSERKQMTGQANVNATKLKAMPITLPSLPEQRRIIAYLDNLQEQLQAKVNTIKHLQAEIAAELDALLPSILDKTFKVEL